MLKRTYPLIVLCSGLFVGFLCGAMITTAYSDDLKFNYDQVVAQVGETKITRSQLAEQAIAMAGPQLLKGELQDRALISEVARRSGITVTRAEIDQRYNEMLKFSEGAMAKKRLESVPRAIIDNDIRMVLYAEKAMDITVTEKDARDFFVHHASLFTHPAMAKLVCISTTDRAKANEVYNRLKGGEDPRKLSVLYSTADVLKQKKGDIGWFLRSSMSPQVAEAIFDANNGKGLGKGEYTKPIETQSPDPTRDGEMMTEYVVFYIDDIQTPVVFKFEEVKDSAMFYCRATKYTDQANTWFAQQARTIGKDWKVVTDIYDPLAQLQAIPIDPAKYAPRSNNDEQ